MDKQVLLTIQAMMFWLMTVYFESVPLMILSAFCFFVVMIMTFSSIRFRPEKDENSETALSSNVRIIPSDNIEFAPAHIREPLQNQKTGIREDATND